MRSKLYAIHVSADFDDVVLLRIWLESLVQRKRWLARYLVKVDCAADRVRDRELADRAYVPDV
jgi:hypothetical protein